MEVIKQRKAGQHSGSGQMAAEEESFLGSRRSSKMWPAP